MHDLAGADLDGLRIIEKLGSGGMGEVWRGHDVDLDIPVAIKVLKPEFVADQNFLVRFLREARACAKLEHPNIVRVMQAGRKSWHGGNLRIMVMEFVDGQDAHELLKAQRKGKLKPERAAEIVLAAAKALKYAHGKGVIHRDIKPANILVGKDGAIKVLDFGLAKLTSGWEGGRPRPPQSNASSNDEEKASSTNAILGTPHYMPPEQAQGRPADGRADVYSLGITLYQLLTGVLPFDGDNAFSIISGHVREELPLKEELFGDLPPVFTELISGMCEKSPDDRIPLKTIIDKLAEWLGGSAPSPYQSNQESDGGRARPPSRTNLQPRNTSFVGRETELIKMKELFESSRLVTVLGPGGVGKTRLTQEYGLSVLNDFDGGVYFCDLTEARSIEGIASDVAKGLGIPLTGDGVEQIHASLRYRQGSIFLILDNFEQVINHAAETLGVWMRDTPSVKFLASSREPLHLEGEHSFPLAPLGDEPSSDCPEVDASASEQRVSKGDRTGSATQLFTDRAAMAKRGFALTDENRDAIADICKQLDGIPLAIELAAARCSALAPKKILERLPQRFDLLKSRRKDQSQRQLTLLGAIQWSWDLLKDYERAALVQCAIFQGGFFLEAAEAVIDVEDFADAPFEIDVIESLVEKSLISTYEVPNLPGETRYRLLESIRQFAEMKWQSDEASQRHAEFYLEYAEEWDNRIKGPDGLEALTRTELEIDNLFAVQDGVGESEPTLSARAILSLSFTLTTRGPIKSLIPRLESALEAMGKNDPDLRCQLLSALCRAHTDFGNRAKAQELGLMAVQESRLLASEPGQKLLAGALFSLGLLYNYKGDWDEALACFGEAETISREHGDRLRVAECVRGRATILQDRGDFDVALVCYAESEKIQRDLGNRHGVAEVVGNRGTLFLNSGENDAALAAFAEAEATMRKLGDLSGIARNVGNQGGVYMVRGDLDTALLCCAKGEAIYRELGDRSGIAAFLGNQGIFLSMENRMAEAWAPLESAEGITRKIGGKDLLPYLLQAKVNVLLELNQDLALAHQMAQECLEMRREQGAEKSHQFFAILAINSQVYLRLSREEVTEGKLRPPTSRQSEEQHHLAKARKFASDAEALGEELGISRVIRKGPKQGQVGRLWQWIEEALAADGA